LKNELKTGSPKAFLFCSYLLEFVFYLRTECQFIWKLKKR